MVLIMPLNFTTHVAALAFAKFPKDGGPLGVHDELWRREH